MRTYTAKEIREKLGDPEEFKKEIEKEIAKEKRFLLVVDLKPILKSMGTSDDRFFLQLVEIKNEDENAIVVQSREEAFEYCRDTLLLDPKYISIR